MRNGLLGLVATALMILTGGCTQSSSQRFLLRVVVNTPEGPRSGSSVVAETNTPTRWLSLGDNRYTASFQGEAVSVELPNNRNLFVLLHNGHSLGMGELIGRALYPKGRADGEPLRTPQSGPFEMPEKARGLDESGRPLFVTFDDVDDPATIKSVDPENLGATFGEGYSLGEITVEVTEQAVTTGIERKLPWLLADYGRMVGRGFRPEGIPVGDFKRLFSTELG